MGHGDKRAAARVRSWLGIACLAVLAACGGSDEAAPDVAETPVNALEACNDLAQLAIGPQAIGLPTGGATVGTSTLVEATATLPEHCAVQGAIAPVDPAAPPINFRVNLPTEWNGKAMQFGGGGFNGTVVTGVGSAPLAPAGTPFPLARGYVTLGSDSGHSGGSLAFALNAESFANFSHEQMKKTRDVAVELMRLRYGRTPSHTYWVGSSQGGREGLMVAQRYPDDYDGVFANVPVGASFVAKAIQGVRSGQALAAPGAWLNPAKVNLVSTATRAACDSLDGLTDNTVANLYACNFNPVVLRCAGGADTGNDCLSDPQLAALSTIHTPLALGFSLSHGITSYPSTQWGSENDPSNNFQQWVTGSSSNALGQIHAGGANFLRYAVAQDAPGFNALTFDPAHWQTQLQQVSAVHDASNPDLSRFLARGGKLLVTESGGDYSHSPQATADYIDAVQARMGASETEKFVRFYVVSGAEHGNRPTSGWPAVKLDAVSLLEDWVERGIAPADKLRLTAHAAQAPFEVTAVRPLCRHPSYPHYGGGDVNLLESFTCVTTPRLISH